MRWELTSRLGLLFLIGLLLAGCSSGGASGRPELVAPDRLTVGVDLSYPPYNYFDSGRPSGFDVDFDRALAQRMGLRPEFVDTSFEQLIAGLKAQRYDVAISALYITPERAKEIDFVPYFTTGNSLVVRTDSPLRPAGPAELCGQRVGVIKGGQIVTQLREQASAACVREGRPGIDVREFASDPVATQALIAGQLDVQATDAAVAKAAVDHSGRGLVITSSGLLYPTSVGIGLARSNPALKEQVTKAFEELKASGEYDRLLQRYNLRPVDPELVRANLGTPGEDDGFGFDWAYTVGLFGNIELWNAALMVAVLAVLAWSIATVLGMGLALLKRSELRVLSVPASAYVWFFRSLPLLVLLIFIYNLPQVIPELRPVLGSPFVVGLVALVLSETAYIAEIHRGGLKSVAVGQGEAARALGIPYGGVQRLVVIPQAFRVALPSLGNQFITILKLTSLVSSISLAEILLVGQRLYTQNFKVLETLLAVSIFYVVLVTLFDQVRAFVERRLDVRRRVRGDRSPVVQGADMDVIGAPRIARRRVPHSGREVVKLRGVRKHFGDRRGIDGIDVTVHQGEVVAVIGPSGAGKSTLARVVNHLEVPDEGTVEVNGRAIGRRADGRPAGSRELAEQRRDVGMVFQRFNLFPHKTVLENVMLAPAYLRVGAPDEIRANALELLRKVGLSEHLQRYPHELSGGQQQRVAIARALAMRPSVLLFDEPTSALDPELVGEVLSVMSDLAQEGRTMLVVTHELRFVRDIADWVVFVDHGRILRQGRPEEILRGAGEQRIERFFASVNP
ncbi:ABC transporter permease subunit [Saccharopolyspora erythraea]|nr:ABC transporter permease subunit [Saccharopolyspora erythraea]QUH00882.1 ABC transporter permease subunit [Saccharopolyspora erythraea]